MREHLKYQRLINLSAKGLFVFLLDQSSSMSGYLEHLERSKMEEAARIANTFIQNIAIKATGREGVDDIADIVVLGYRTDSDGQPVVESVLGGDASQTGIRSIDDLARNPIQIEEQWKEFVDEESGEVTSVPMKVPVWVTPSANGGAAPMGSALQKSYDIARGWIEQHPGSFPPLVVLVTGGGPADEAASLYHAELLKSLATTDGNVLLLVIYLSSDSEEALGFPRSHDQLNDEMARLLFLMSSVLPVSICLELKAEGQDLRSGARGMGINEDLTSLLSGMQWGSGGTPSICARCPFLN